MIFLHGLASATLSIIFASFGVIEYILLSRLGVARSLTDPSLAFNHVNIMQTFLPGNTVSAVSEGLLSLLKGGLRRVWCHTLLCLYQIESALKDKAGRNTTHW